MRLIQTSRALRFGLLLLGVGVASGFLLTLSAYDFYENQDGLEPGDPNFRTSNNCFSCHEEAATGIPGFDKRGDLHAEGHQGNATNNCRLCHSSTGDIPRLNSSDSGAQPGCIGCHGLPLSDGTMTGAGLRLHHSNAGVPPDADGNFCVTCHQAGGPGGPEPETIPPESAIPVYYTRVVEDDVVQTDPCNGDTLEDWWTRLDGVVQDGLGLDNDGDLLVDAADPDCSIAPPEIANVGFNDPAIPMRLTWDPQDSELYDVIRSDGPQYPETSALTACLEQATPLAWNDDTEPVPQGAVFFYLVRNTLAANYGAMSDGSLREYSACP